MMRKLALGMGLMTCLLSYGQEVDIKKDKVLIDNKEVANTNKEKKNIVLSTLDNSSSYTFTKETARLDNKTDVLIYDVTDSKSGKSNTLIFDNAIMGLGGEKILVKNLLKKSELFNNDGLNIAKINDFLNAPKVVALDVLKTKNDSISARIKSANLKFKEDQLGFSTWNIIDKKKPENNNVIAFLKMSKVDTFTYTIEVFTYDEKKNQVKVGIWSNGAEVINFEGKKQKLSDKLITINGDEVLTLPDMFKGNEAKMIADSDPARRIAVFMHEFGYY